MNALSLVDALSLVECSYLWLSHPFDANEKSTSLMIAMRLHVCQINYCICFINFLHAYQFINGCSNELAWKDLCRDAAQFLFCCCCDSAVGFCCFPSLHTLSCARYSSDAGRNLSLSSSAAMTIAAAFISYRDQRGCVTPCTSNRLESGT